ncbi:formate dehydrogenase accessory sulfurtransferase FdhD [Acidocella sp.]|uniref:formate dehydrogenase accessory sulfurtransferase FdhD n=1 Tax=Acidocella sp. TaxID=50710 RepID=UPI003D05B9CB
MHETITPSTLTWPVTRFSSTQTPQTSELPLAEETPINLLYNTLPYATMMATARDIEDFCTGFSVTEGIVERAEDIKSVELEQGRGFIKADMRIPPDRFHRLLRASRRMVVGRTGCGICGMEDASQILRPLPALPPGPPTSLAAIRRGLKALPEQQGLNQEVHMVHGAAWCDMAGKIKLIREDVGRHNALDKLIGAALRGGHDLSDGFCLLTSRCSYEMAQKSIIAGIRTIVAISAPTGLALYTAEQAGLTVVAIARPDAQTLFTGKLSE